MVVQELEAGSVMQEARPEQVVCSHLPATTLGSEEAEEKVAVQELDVGSWCTGGPCRVLFRCHNFDINTVMKYA